MLGLDVSKATLSVTLLDPATRRPLWQQTLPNTQEAVAELLERVPPTTAWVLEPTGSYSEPVARQAKEAGRTVLLASPRRAQLFLQSVQDRAKTDKLDSRGLAQYALAVPLSSYPVKPEKTKQLEQLLKARRGLSHSLMRLSQQAEELPYASAALQPAIQALKEQRDEVDAQIEALVKEKGAFPLVSRLRAVSGIGPVTAATVAVVLTSRQFAHPDQFVAYAGLDVRVRQSGQKEARLGISHRGDAELRRLLYLAAQANIRVKGSPFAALYREQREKGRSGTAALCIVARKLAKVCWSLHKHEGEYDPQRVRQPLH